MERKPLRCAEAEAHTKRECWCASADYSNKFELSGIVEWKFLSPLNAPLHVFGEFCIIRKVFSDLKIYFWGIEEPFYLFK